MSDVSNFYNFNIFFSKLSAIHYFSPFISLRFTNQKVTNWNAMWVWGEKQGRYHLNLWFNELFLRFSEKYLEFPKFSAIFVPKNNKDENNIQKYIGWILYQESSGEDSTGGMVREDEEVGMDLFRWYQEYV